MKEYELYTVENGTEGLDTEVNLTLKVNRDSTPIKLSDFNGGTAELYDGYSTYTSIYTIKLNKNDSRRIVLVNKENTHKIELSPEFIRIKNPKNLLNQLEEINLSLKQDISNYTIIHSNFELK